MADSRLGTSDLLSARGGHAAASLPQIAAHYGLKYIAATQIW